ncbi:uncharacterized protein LOC126368286 [Pectinophora gossypiella]|uniref:uncharacterized protein LOC126368286 n=1 Tax=Pectinophora gossypiella TaxID=13191 RepID=UPI00214F291C|nr:uncharacterized protein LOC126368286 [Pectinophora gossypiella]
MTVSVSLSSCWQYFTTMEDLKLSNSPPMDQIVHSEYIYGWCNSTDLKFYTHVELNHIDIIGKPIVRGWIQVPQIPTCIRLRALAYEEDTFRSTAYPFQMCVPRITYCHQQIKFAFYYYEWYIPEFMEGGMNWDIFFFGPEKLYYM